MTVRFSDFIGKGHRKGHKAHLSGEGTQAQKVFSQELKTEHIHGFSDPFSADRYDELIDIPKERFSLFSDFFSADLYNEKAKAYYKALLEKSTDIRDQVKSNQALSHSPILSILNDIIEDELVDQLYEYAISVPDGKGFQSHSVCITLGSLKVGQGMGYNEKALLKLGLAAFLENVGKYKVPDHILEKKGELSPDEMNAVTKYSEFSSQILEQMGAIFQWLAETASQVHERSDGSGYPKGLGEEEITEAASIIGIIDTYMAMIKDRPHREKITPTDAVEAIIETCKRKFPTRVLKEFLNQISLFPLNTYVRLNNKSIGRVIAVHRNHPLRPTIELLYDGLGQEKEEKEAVSLSEFPLLHVVGTINESESH